MYRAKAIDAFMRERYVCLRTQEDADHAISAKRREQIGRQKPFRFRKGGFLYDIHFRTGSKAAPQAE